MMIRSRNQRSKWPEPKVFALLLNFLIFVAREIQGDVVVKPQHTIKYVGEKVTFQCTSNIADRNLIWFTSHGRQQATNEIKENSEKFKIYEAYNETRRQSTFEIYNISMADAGTIFCRDDGDFGNTESAKLCVAHDIDSRAMCNNDRLTVVCSTCYWGEIQLQFTLQYLSSIKPNMSTEIYDNEKGCFQHTAVWLMQTSCQKMANTEMTALFGETSANIQVSSNVSKIFITDPESPDTLVTKSPPVNGRIVTFNPDEIFMHIDRSDDLNNNMDCHTKTVILATSITVTVAVVILLAIQYLVYRRRIKRKAKMFKDQKNGEKLQHAQISSAKENTACTTDSLLSIEKPKSETLNY